MGLVFISFEQSNDVFIAHKDDYTLEQCIMGNTYVLVCSLPVNSKEDCVCVKEKRGHGKGEEKRKKNLTINKSGETFTPVSLYVRATGA